MIENPLCEDCGMPCELIEETFSYTGTHCTYGRSGTHHTGVYVSKCCGGEYADQRDGIAYKNWVISYDPKPIPDRRFDFDAVHEEYDGPEDGRAFSAASLDEAKQEIDDWDDNH